ncbi:MAG: A/G-specific adenine glycosylase, partial [Frankiaceae bacterium]|nr:A/G-specific adenine glycosylase [Frankiaceae bacterium]
RPEAGAWAVLVSEFMLQQTPVARVLPVYAEWLARWPAPADLAADSPGEAVRMWGQLGYPRRALRLHACAVAIRAWGRLGYPRRAQRLHGASVAIVSRFGGDVPSAYDDLVSLPGIGGYTARAVRAFGFGGVDVPLDTNVRRVLARVHAGVADAGAGAPTRGEQQLADAFADGSGGVGVALMELGALLCLARVPRCSGCPLAAGCRWRAAGSPPGEARTAQSYAGTDRQARGALLSVLRAADGPVRAGELAAAWPLAEQRERALAGLLADGLAAGGEAEGYALPS